MGQQDKRVVMYVEEPGRVEAMASTGDRFSFEWDADEGRLERFNPGGEPREPLHFVRRSRSEAWRREVGELTSKLGRVTGELRAATHSREIDQRTIASLRAAVKAEQEARAVETAAFVRGLEDAEARGETHLHVHVGEGVSVAYAEGRLVVRPERRAEPPAAAASPDPRDGEGEEGGRG